MKRRRQVHAARASIAPVIMTVIVTVMLTAAPRTVGAHGPPSPEAYRWVSPPPGIESAGEPEHASATYPREMFAGGFSTAWTPDAQATVLLTVPEGATPSDTKVALEPVDANALGDAPTEFAPNGNAYRVSIDTDGWKPDVRVQLTTPYPSEGMWVHDRDEGWHPLPNNVLDSGETLAEIGNLDDPVTVVAAWTSPTHAWWQEVTHSPRNLFIAVMIAGGTGWTIGTRSPRRQRDAPTEP